MADRLACLRSAVPPPRILRDLADIFSVLGHETRLRILSALAAARSARVTDLARALNMTVSALSHQLARMRALRIVSSTRRGRDVLYSLDDRHVAALLRQGRRHAEHP